MPNPDEMKFDAVVSAHDLAAIAAEIDSASTVSEVAPEPVAEAPEDLSDDSGVQSNFRLTSMINAIAGNPPNAGWEAIDKQIDIIRSEFNELRDGIAARDIHELRDGIQDLLFTVYGLAHRAGIDADQDFLEVVRSNLTKFDESEHDALLTRAKYDEQGVATNCVIIRDTQDGRAYYVTRSAKDQNDHRGKFMPGGKWLKSYKFVEPQYDPLPVPVQVMLRTGQVGQQVVHPDVVRMQEKISVIEEQLTLIGYPNTVVSLSLDAPGTVAEIVGKLAAAIGEVCANNGIEDHSGFLFECEMAGDGSVSVSAVVPAEVADVSQWPEGTAVVDTEVAVKQMLAQRGYPNVELVLDPDLTGDAESITATVLAAIGDALQVEGVKVDVRSITAHVSNNAPAQLVFGSIEISEVPEAPAANDDNA